jgi:hypothetical protein
MSYRSFELIDLNLFVSRETRLIETLDNVCERFLQYNVHAERPGSLRYARGRSQTMDTLWNLRLNSIFINFPFFC